SIDVLPGQGCSDRCGRHRPLHPDSSGTGDYSRSRSAITNNSECGLALPKLPCGQDLRLKLMPTWPVSSSRKFLSTVAEPSSASLTMLTLWSPSRPDRATK